MRRLAPRNHENHPVTPGPSPPGLPPGKRVARVASPVPPCSRHLSAARPPVSRSEATCRLWTQRPASGKRSRRSLLGPSARILDLGDRNVIFVSSDSRTHRGFARRPVARPEIPAGYPHAKLHLVDSIRHSVHTPGRGRWPSAPPILNGEYFVLYFQYCSFWVSTSPRRPQ